MRRDHAVTPAVTVTASVTAVTLPVTPTEAQMIEAAVHPEHECPICGMMHRRPLTNAQRQKAFRERHK